MLLFFITSNSFKWNKFSYNLSNNSGTSCEVPIWFTMVWMDAAKMKTGFGFQRDMSQNFKEMCK